MGRGACDSCRHTQASRRQTAELEKAGLAKRCTWRAIQLATDQMAYKRLRSSASLLWLPHYEANHGPLDASVGERLLTISPATIDRLLAPVRAQAGRCGFSGTKPGTLLKNQILLRANTWGCRCPVLWRPTQLPIAA